jgi:thiamine-monophosphate kinase
MTRSASRATVAGRLSEFDLIEELFAPLATAPGAFRLKDDAAQIAPLRGHGLVVTTDALVAGVDFFAADPPAQVAKKALRVNLSDLAAKGARPFAYLLTLILPRSTKQAWLNAFARGLKEDQSRFAIALLGGDISSTEGPLTVSITALGRAPRGGMLRRRGARIGDLVFVTGTIGDSAGGLALLRASDGGGTSPAQRRRLIQAYRVPTPPVRFGLSLPGLASAAIDVSDGLLADLGHVAEASGARILIEAARLPRSGALRALWGDGLRAVARAAGAGDDYQIAFTAPRRAESKILAAAARAQTRVTRIGRVEKGSGVTLLDDKGRPIGARHAGFTHF